MNYLEISRFFSKKCILDKILEDDFNLSIFKEEVENKYTILGNEYRNEYFYKNTLFNKYVIGKFSLNTTVAFNEVIIGKSKADLAIINNKRGMVFEIKTDLDNIQRLNSQLNDYYKVFSEVYVVTSEKHYYPVYKFIKNYNPNVGIIVLTKEDRLSRRKKAEIDNSKLEHEKLFKLMRKEEYETLVVKKFKQLPNAKPVEFYKACFNKFKEIGIEESQNLVFTELKKRKIALDADTIINLPKSIRWLIYVGRFKNKEYKKINERFKK